ncbi:fimbria/pilus periplasmic chaperone [Salmonella enterica subsp. enterica serovar Muenchen]|nr:fimbria/pilus periplasmic chaperone [Salmonella enterica subsp. enterica serovar Muenchen]ECZ7909681.1 fimbria/pilus periplasmic chaperone [Salmonella enterica subsp. enterica serovar Muenchen]
MLFKRTQHPGNVPVLPFSPSVLLLSGQLFLTGISVAHATENPQIQQNTQSFSVILGATRVIYAPDSSGVTLSVNNPQTYPILVQSRVFSEDMKNKAPFVVTPPLFRLDGNQQSRLRIVRIGGNFIGDREYLHWLCVKGIPPKKDDLWLQNKKAILPDTVSLNVQLSIDNCIKLFVRPESVKGHPSDVADSLIWSRVNNKLQASNPTPFYMNLSSVRIGGGRVEQLHYIPPFSSYAFDFPSGSEVSNSRQVQWSVITDYGGESPIFHGAVK